MTTSIRKRGVRERYSDQVVFCTLVESVGITTHPREVCNISIVVKSEDKMRHVISMGERPLVFSGGTMVIIG